MKKLLSILLSALILTALAVPALATEAPTPEVVSLGVGEMWVYDFGDVKLHAYKTNDPIDDESFLLETADAVIGIESPSFYSNLDEYTQYISSLGKPMNHLMLPYHPAGADVFEDVIVTGTEEARAAQADGGSVKGLVDSFVEAFGADFNGNIPAITDIVEPGTITLDGVDFIITATADGYDIEIPAINAVFTHMFGHDVHNILVSTEQIDAMIAQVKAYQDKGFALVLSSHYTPENQADVSAKLAYLETTKELAETSDSAEVFTAAMNEAFPDYSGANYLEISAGALFQ